MTKKIVFEEDELIIMAMFEKEDKQETIRETEDVLLFVSDDEIEPLVIGTIEKLKLMSDEEFAKLDLEEYKQEPVDE